jgi:hypothetical protein
MGATLFVIIGTTLLGATSPPVAAPVELKVKIETGFPDAANAVELLERLNTNGGEDNLKFQMVESGYELRIAVATRRSGVRLGAAEGTAAVLTPDGRFLFLIARQGRFTQAGVLNAITKEITRRLALYLNAKKPVQATI